MTPVGMNAPAVARRPLPAIRAARQPSAAAAAAKRFKIAIIVQTLVCGVPTAILLMAGRPALAGTTFWSLVGVLMLRLVLLGRSYEIVALIIALTPFFNLLRNFAFFNIVVAVFAGSFLYLHFRSPTAIPAVIRRFPLAGWLAAFVCVHYAVSYALTGNYAVNIRGFELAGAAFVVLIIARDVGQLAPALAGLTISAIAIGAAMVPHIGSMSVERLGIVVLDGILLGNPVQLGLPLALACVTLLVDSGRWSGIRRPALRWPLLVAACGLLALTSSRAAWAVVAAGLVVVLLFGGRQRLGILLVLGAGLIGAQLLLLTPYGEGFQMGLERTFSEERDVRTRTSGRSDQWIVAYAAVTESADSVIRGHGPGLSPIVYARKSLEIPGIEYGVGQRVPFHSFYMQIAVEAGLIGLLAVIGFLTIAVLKSVGWTYRTRMVLPLACLFGYAVIAATVSGYDTVSGVFLGLGLLSTGRHPGNSPPRSAPGAAGDHARAS